MDTSNLVTVLEHSRLVLYFDFASAAIALYDYILTLELETRHMWFKQRWSLIRILFFINRYTPFVDITFSLYNVLLPTEQGCTFMNKFSGCEQSTILTRVLRDSVVLGSFCLSIALSEVILTMRTWSLWKGWRWSCVALVAFYLSCWIPIGVLLDIFFAHAEVYAIRLPGYATCLVIPGNKSLYICWTLLLAYDTGTLALMIVAGTRSYTQLYGRLRGSSALLRTIYRDGITYYIALFILALMNIVTVAMLPKEFVNLFSVLMRAVHSTLTSRVVLHLREQAERSTVFPDSTFDITYHSTGPS
ncbi:hypothetical protein PC9H_009360 [Pleurotus ostreatus]|uniref:DUF6533 domain-containing protein n=1 Tax=Pleurotus ostreatus TaxID=5322 RepID=A0A8H7DMV6_PLEOS|nr:uncharacterized protein PC9H_009360 [Pleurotus ostreatus]KAF7424059.1 hypothetical protein PC9H_009360 [Pleurotus ostreatus]KAJ8693127.1 hypothetical protein PTI98_010370 [Pleurotus ostreatus]